MSWVEDEGQSDSCVSLSDVSSGSESLYSSSDVLGEKSSQEMSESELSDSSEELDSWTSSSGRLSLRPCTPGCKQTIDKINVYTQYIQH